MNTNNPSTEKTPRPELGGIVIRYPVVEAGVSNVSAAMHQLLPEMFRKIDHSVAIVSAKEAPASQPEPSAPVVSHPSYDMNNQEDRVQAARQSTDNAFNNDFKRAA